jgi:hypothetical protein
MLQNASFLSRLYRLSARGQKRLAAAKVMEYVDKLLRESSFAGCRRLLDSVDVARLKKFPTVLLAFLGITLAAKEELSPSRKKFCERVRTALVDELGSEERVGRILARF